MTAYKNGVGRTPKCRVLAISQDKEWVKIQEITSGNPMETNRPSGEPYWCPEDSLFARLSTSNLGARYTLEGAPSYRGVPTEDPPRQRG